MPIKKALLILLLIAVIGFIFVFTVYYYKTVLSVDLYQNNINTTGQKDQNRTENIGDKKAEEKTEANATNTLNIIELSKGEITDKDQADNLLKALNQSQKNENNNESVNIEVNKAETEARLKLVDYLNQQK